MQFTKITAESVPLRGGRRGGDHAMGWEVWFFPENNINRGKDSTTHKAHTPVRDKQTLSRAGDTTDTESLYTELQFVSMPSKPLPCSSRASAADTMAELGGFPQVTSEKKSKKSSCTVSTDSCRFITLNEKATLSLGSYKHFGGSKEAKNRDHWSNI